MSPGRVCPLLVAGPQALERGRVEQGSALGGVVGVSGAATVRCMALAVASAVILVAAAACRARHAAAGHAGDRGCLQLRPRLQREYGIEHDARLRLQQHLVRARRLSGASGYSAQLQGASARPV